MYASRSRDVKIQYVCKDHMSMSVTCDTCKNKNEIDELDTLRCFFQLFFKPFYHIYVHE
jgi:hypothetical protein